MNATGHSGPPPSGGPSSIPEVSQEHVLTVVARLQTLRDELPPSEQLFMDRLFEYFVAKAGEEPSIRELLARLPEGEELLDDVAGFAMADGRPSVALIPTTYTDTMTHISPLCVPPPEY